MPSDTDQVCRYCRHPARLHGESPAGPDWVECPDGSGRAVTVLAHFGPPGPTSTCERCGHTQPLPHAVARHLGPAGGRG